MAGGRSREGPLRGLWRWVGKGRDGGGEQGWCRQDGAGAVTRRGQTATGRGSQAGTQGLTPEPGGEYFGSSHRKLTQGAV